MPSILSQITGQLIVSCQPVPGGPMDRPDIVAAFAEAALAGGAAGVRIEGVENVAAVRRATNAPLIGLIKNDLTDSAVRITPFVHQVHLLVAAGADIVAFDATQRPRPEPVADLIAAIHALGAIAMADCATLQDAQIAHSLGAEILGTTMSGYTGDVVPEGPDLELVAAMARIGGFVIAEGRYHTPAQAAQAMQAGAHAVVAGSAITRVEHVTSWFVQALARTTHGSAQRAE